MDFFQDPPRLQNSFVSDPLLSHHLRRLFAPPDLKTIELHLQHVGEQAVTDWLQWSLQAEAQEPQHVPFDPWGRRIDQIQLSEGWKNLEKAAAQEGLVAAGYERKYGELSRVYQAALLYLFHPSSAFVSCPLAMTDGAARALELYGNQDLKDGAFRRLTSRDPRSFWTSGQWMTERTGGSDVSGTSTTARRNGAHWTLSGVKWFTSATTSPMAMLLARPEGAETGSRGLSLFYVELRNAEGCLQNIEILRLKDKLGTRALPTAELRLNETPARLVGSEGQGVRKISSLFNITRIYNSICALGHWRRSLDWAWSYSNKRMAFGKKIVDHPLHRATMASQEKEFRKAFELTFFVAHLLGKDECGTASENEKVLLRALTPIVKLFTAKRCLEGVSEVVEVFGGVGYCEDSGIPTLLRDAQVFSIWEGTTNVLALDFLRALEKESAGPVLIEKIQRDFAPRWAQPESDRHFLEFQTILGSGASKEELEVKARQLSFLVAEVFASGLIATSGDR